MGDYSSVYNAVALLQERAGRPTTYYSTTFAVKRIDQRPRLSVYVSGQ